MTTRVGGTPARRAWRAGSFARQIERFVEDEKWEDAMSAVVDG